MMEKVNKSDIINKQSLSCESSLELRNKVKNMKRFYMKIGKMETNHGKNIRK